MNQNNGKSKKNKIIIILMIFVLVILIATYIGYSYYLKNNNQVTLKNEFFSKVRNHELEFFAENKLYTILAEKVEKNEYNSSSNVKLATTMENNMFSELDLSKFEFNYNFTKKGKNLYGIFESKYAGNSLLTLDFISTDNQLALKSDEIVNKYVGLDKNNIEDVINKIAETEVDFASAKKMKNFLADRQNIDFSSISQNLTLGEYANLFKENISNGMFSKKENVIVTLDSEQIETTEYTIELSENQTSNLLSELSKKIENDNQLMAELIVSNVQDFENDDAGIVDYTDNDNVSEVQAEENNFNTSLQIWSGNTTHTINVTTNEVVSETDEVITNTNTENVVQNTIQNSPTNSVQNPGENEIQNTVQNQVQNNVINQVTNEIENTMISNNTAQNITVENATVNEEQAEAENTVIIEQVEQPSDVENQVQEHVVEEDENLRMQGFIEINDENVESLSEDSFIIGEDYESTLKNINDLSNGIDWWTYLLTGAKTNCTQEELVEILTAILENKSSENNKLIIKMYINEDKLVKMNFAFSESKESFDYEIISKGNNEKYLNIKILQGEAQNSNGYNIILYKKDSENSAKIKLNINRINKSKITEKTTINLATNGATNSKKYNSEFDILYVNGDGEFKTEISNTFDFDDVQKNEQLNDENCLFIDNISNEELLQTRDAIKEKLLQVLREKNRNLNMIDINNSNSIVEQTEQNVITENLEDKEQAKQALVQTISVKMGDYINQGLSLRIEDLQDLEIPGYEVNVSVSSNLAIITVNGYKFKLDSEFNLSDS